MTTETTLPPVFTSVCYTGQPETEHEEVVCNACKTGRIGVRGSAWFDPYLPHGNHYGSYVHFNCLSPLRKEELRLKGYRFEGDPS